jgi:hypothetical protein
LGRASEKMVEEELTIWSSMNFMSGSFRHRNPVADVSKRGIGVKNAGIFERH